jgi:hypothetical protein
MEKRFILCIFVEIYIEWDSCDVMELTGHMSPTNQVLNYIYTMYSA